jgi:hypothetical protein
MKLLQEMIDELSRRADDSDLIALLATSHQGRLYNTVLARELRDVAGALRRELEVRRLALLRQSNDIRLGSPKES